MGRGKATSLFFAADLHGSQVAYRKFLSAARFYGVDPREMLGAGSIDEQRAFFAQRLAPIFEKRLVRWLTGRKSSLYGLGIPPQQYDALATAGDGMSAILRARLEKLACGFPLSENYFAWQAFARRYDADGPLPPYLKAEHRRHHPRA